MPNPPDSAEVPSEAATVVQRYHRIERPVSWGVSLLFAAVVTVALFSLSLIPALLVAIAVLALARFPLLRSHGSMELVTSDSAETARARFESAIPPVLAFQWGLADDIRSTSDGWAYDISYLFGLISITMEIETNSLPLDGESKPSNEFELTVMANGKAWGTYLVSIHEQGGKTAVDIEYESARKFGLRRLPQWLVAERYRDEALAVQGYTITERDFNLSVR